MLVKKRTRIIMNNAKDGVNIRQDTTLGAWKQNHEMKIAIRI
mgnify:CR=1 FL=1